MSGIFTTERLRARRWTMDDVAAAYAIYSDPEVMRWLGDGRARPVRNEAVMRQVIEARTLQDRGAFGMWALELLDDRAVVGSVILAPLENVGPEFEIGWHLTRAHWGNGYATEGARGLLRYGFDVVGLARIVAVVYPENERSLKVCQRLGMRHEGRMRAYDHDLERYVAEPDQSPAT